MAIILAILWTIPTFGLFVTSFRPKADIDSSGWWTFFANPGVTLDNYKQAFGGSGGLGPFFLNSFVIVIPAVIIPITLALFAAYAFAWIEFKGRDFLFVAIFALQIVPLQVASWYRCRRCSSAWACRTRSGRSGSRTRSSLCRLAIFIMHNFMKEIPRSIVEAARVDGAGHVKIFFVVLMPLLMPAIAAFGIFQFLWVWNDLLVALVVRAQPEPAPRSPPRSPACPEPAARTGSCCPPVRSSRSSVPLIVFLSLQRYFVRGLLAGGVKG